MAKLFYYYVNSVKIGPITGPQLAALAANARIDENTVIEGDGGVQCVAGNVQGLVFPPKQKIPPEIPVANTQGFTQPDIPVVNTQGFTQPDIPVANTQGFAPRGFVPTYVQANGANNTPIPEPSSYVPEVASVYVENMYENKRDKAAYKRTDYKITWFRAILTFIGVMYAFVFGLIFCVSAGVFFGGMDYAIIGFLVGTLVGSVVWGITYMLFIFPFTIHIELLQQIRDK